MAKRVRFGDIASFKYGKMPNKKRITENGKYPIYSGYRYVGFYDEYNIEANQLIIVARGVGGTGDVKLTKERCYLTNLSIAADIDTNVVVPEYLYYYFMSQNLRYLDSGSAQSQITISDLERVIILVPSLSDQQIVCSYLKLLDKKIENNKEINKNLEQQMLAIFDNAKRTSSWNNHKLGDVLTFFDNLRKPLSSIQRGKMAHIYPYYGATSIVDYVEDFLFDGTYILISEDGANVIDIFGHLLTQYTYGKFWINNHAHIVKGINNYSDALIYAMLGTLNMQSIVTGAAQPKINQANLRNFEAALPECEEAQALSDVLNPMFQQIIYHDQENEKLSALRDILLPQLMFGKLDVSDIII